MPACLPPEPSMPPSVPSLPCNAIQLRPVTRNADIHAIRLFHPTRLAFYFFSRRPAQRRRRRRRRRALTLSAIRSSSWFCSSTSCPVARASTFSRPTAPPSRSRFWSISFSMSSSSLSASNWYFARSARFLPFGFGVVAPGCASSLKFCCSRWFCW